jgi:hypothetical protein
MYGLVNKAIAELVISRYGQNQWQMILDDADINDDSFIGMESYPDESTYALVRSASKILNLPQESVLEAFGEYWIQYTATEGYGNLLDMAGNTLLEFLTNLDQLHSCVGHIMPKLTPPSFRCTDIKPHSLILHHYTQRPGMEYMVVGLLRGLGKRFNTECTVSIRQSFSKGGSHNVYFVEWL